MNDDHGLIDDKTQVDDRCEGTTLTIEANRYLAGGIHVVLSCKRLSKNELNI